MGSVPPIHGPGEEHGYIPPIQPFHTVAPESSHALENSEIDALRLQQEPAYVNQVLNWILYQARTAFNVFQYAAAQEHYEEYFRYLAYYRGDNFYSTPVNYVSALFEQMWTLEIQDGDKEATRLFNLELVKLTEPTPQNQSLQPMPLQQQVAQLTQQGLLPTAESLFKTVSPQVLQSLGQLAYENQAPVLATRLLGLAQVLSYLEVYRIQRQSAEITQEVSGHPVPYTALPFGYKHFGVPVAPVLPQPPDMAQRVAPKIHIDPYHVDRVEPVYALNKDPRDSDRRRRNRRRSAYLQGKGEKPLSKPKITF